MISYCLYHKHSAYTNVRISDSATTLEDYAKRAVELGHTILSSCEHGWQGGVWETVTLAKKYGLKPLISAECYWVKDRKQPDKTNSHIFIAAMNEAGRRELNDILSEANISGFYVQPRIDLELLMSLSPENVVVTTACIAYYRYNDIDEITMQLAKHFRNHFFLEVQYHNTEKQRQTNEHILELHNKYHIPLIMGCDSHYIYPKDAQTRSDFLMSKGIQYPDENGWYLDYCDGDEAYHRFAEQCVLSHEEIMEAINNTNIFNTVEEYECPIFNDDIKMPSLYPELPQDERDKIYKRLVLEGWDNYKINVPQNLWPHYEEEINKEMQTVIDTHMADYFIINHNIIKRGKENGGWLTKSGRGSAVSYVTNMLLGFTEVDRIAAKIHMYPERFMSATRILESHSLPDIDFNVAPVEPFARAQKEILGDDHAYPMVSYGTMQKSAAWKLYAKSQGIAFELANAVSEQIKKYEMAVKHASEDDKDDINVLDYIDEEYKDVYEKSKEYLGLITSWSIAPCSYLLYDGSIRKEIGLVKIKDHLCCVMDGHWAEAAHFLKNDLLKVSVVDLIYRSYHRIGLEPPSVSELLSMCNKNDEAWDMYSKGCTLGLNQVEQVGTSSRVSKYKPKNISELGAFVAAIRPGFKSMYRKFESREPFSYNVKAFDDLVQTDEMPNSFLLYQEQEMAALNYAGIDMTDCYTAIKNIAKKRVDKVLAYKSTFIEGIKRTIINDEHRSEEDAQLLATTLWQIIEDSASYSFNASHSYCVALDSLYCAWLKAHHPLEFYETLLSVCEKKGDKDKMNAVKQEAEDYFKIKFPPFRFGQDNRAIKCNISTNEITNSLSSIKGYSTDISNSLYECSKLSFTSFIDVLRWLDCKSIKAAKLRPLILIDYFQEFGNSKQLTIILDAWDLLGQGNAKSVRKDKLQDSLLLPLVASICRGTNKNGETSSMYRFESISAFEALKLFEKNVKESPKYLDDYPMSTKVRNNIDILGYVDITTQRKEDVRRLLIIDVSPLKDVKNNIWAYRIGTKSLGSGKSARVTIKSDVFDNRPLKPGNIIYATELYKNQSDYWYITSYQKEA